MSLEKQLFEACYEDNIKKVKELIKKGAKVNVTDNAGWTPLSWVCSENKIEIAKLLIEKGAKVNVSDTLYKYTPLQWVVKYGNIELVELLLKNGAYVNGYVLPTFSPLCYACERNYTEIAKLLIEKGADVNAIGGVQKLTPLYLASKEGNIEIVNLLLETGSIIISEKEISIAYYNNHTEIAKLLIDKVDIHSVLYIACIERHTKVAELLIDKGADVNLAHYNGDTPLLEACKNNDPEMVELLIDNGANVHIANDNGFTPFYKACDDNYIKITKLIINSILLRNLEEEKPDFANKRQELSDYWDKCKTEVLLLKKITFGQVSLFNFCSTENISKLADTCHKEVIQKVITKSDLIDKYPIFGKKIKENFEKGLARNKALNTALNSVYYNNKNDKLLPPECWKKILENLGPQDLKNVTNVASLFFKLTSADSKTSEVAETNNSFSKS